MTRLGSTAPALHADDSMDRRFARPSSHECGRDVLDFQRCAFTGEGHDVEPTRRSLQFALMKERFGCHEEITLLVFPHSSFRG